MALDHDRASFQSQTFAGVFVSRSFIGPVTDLVTVDPGCHVRTVDDQCLVKPLEVLGHHAARILAPKKSARTAILRSGSILVLNAIVNLAFVTHHHVPGDAAEEDP